MVDVTGDGNYTLWASADGKGLCVQSGGWGKLASLVTIPGTTICSYLIEKYKVEGSIEFTNSHNESVKMTEDNKGLTVEVNGIKNYFEDLKIVDSVVDIYV